MYGAFTIVDHLLSGFFFLFSLLFIFIRFRDNLLLRDLTELDRNEGPTVLLYDAVTFKGHVLLYQRREERF